jgi:integrase
VSAIWRCSISRWTANCRPAISSACKSAMFGIRIACASGGVLCCSARVSRCSLRSRPRPKRQSQSGCPFLVLRCDRSISSPAGSIRESYLSGRQYSRLVCDWVEGAGLDPDVYGTQSLRRTKVLLIVRTTGNLKAAQLLLGHTKIESTARYLETELNAALKISEKVEL